MERLGGCFLGERRLWRRDRNTYSLSTLVYPRLNGGNGPLANCIWAGEVLATICGDLVGHALDYGLVVSTSGIKLDGFLLFFSGCFFQCPSTKFRGEYASVAMALGCNIFHSRGL